MLFAYKLIYISDYEEDKQAQIYKELDGSLAANNNESEKDENDDNREDTARQLTRLVTAKRHLTRRRGILITQDEVKRNNIPNQIMFKSKASKSINAVKEGLSDTTLKILKAALKLLKDKQSSEVAKCVTKDTNLYFIPTVCVLEELRNFLMVGEQINSILYGVTYIKNQDFFLSSEFYSLVDCLTDYDRDDMISDKHHGNSTSNFLFSEGDLIFNPSQSFKKKIDHDRKDFWENKLKKFLTRSNEQWIIDQFNLCKKFLNHNSVEGHYDEFCHPAYMKFEHIRKMKEKCSDRKRLAAYNQTFSNLIKINSMSSGFGEDNIQIESDSNQSSYLGSINLEVLKCDIFALLKTIEEIENKINMNKILKSSDMSKYSEKIGQTDPEKYIRNQFAMLNFNRNFIAIKYAQSNPSDLRNNLG